MSTCARAAAAAYGYRVGRCWLETHVVITGFDTCALVQYLDGKHDRSEATAFQPDYFRSELGSLVGDSE
jgi:hypothetical protein